MLFLNSSCLRLADGWLCLLLHSYQGTCTILCSTTHHDLLSSHLGHMVCLNFLSLFLLLLLLSYPLSFSPPFLPFSFFLLFLLALKPSVPFKYALLFFYYLLLLLLPFCLYLLPNFSFLLLPLCLPFANILFVFAFLYQLKTRFIIILM